MDRLTESVTQHVRSRQRMNGRMGRCLVVGLLLASRPGAMDISQLPYSQNKKLIEFGWDLPTAAFVRDNIAQMETRPFDGLIFAPGNSMPHLFNPQPWDESIVDTAALAAISWDRFTDNFLMVWSGDDFGMDYFDDTQWATILDNMRLLGRAASMGGCRGICFDTEFYSQRSPWGYTTERYPDNTEEQVREKMRLRGGQVVAAWQEGMPELRVLSMFLLTYLPETWLLLPSFVNGMLDSLGPESVLIEGNEGTYWVEDGDLFLRADTWRGQNFSYEWIKDTTYYECLIQHIEPENRDKYLRQFQVSRALYADEVYGVYPSGDIPAEFTDEMELRWEHNVYMALLSTDEYVWGYFEDMAWWDNPTARPIGQPIAMDQPFDGVEEGIVSARAKLDAGSQGCRSH